MRPPVAYGACLSLESDFLQALLCQFDPVAAFRLVEIRPLDDIFKDASVLLDRPDRPDIVVVARHKNSPNATLLPGDVQRLAKNRGGIATSSILWHHDVADVSADPTEKVIE